MIIYEDERITVSTVMTNKAKVTLSDRFSGEAIAINRDAFETMCRALARKIEEREDPLTNERV